ncbi:MAG: hypothetical protein IT374_21035 [Polyangiaceae bacterium]|nr:hypothetical protein [Polyangiaceae bacterium]
MPEPTQATQATEAPSDTPAPPPVTDATLVYSASQAVLFSVGGALGGQESGEVWKAEVGPDSATWRRLAVPEGTLGRVLAATYQPSRQGAAAGRLWILDERGSHWAKRARLWLVDAESGAATKAGEWPRLGWFDEQWLALDRDGAVLLSTSSERLRVHVIFRVDAGAQGGLTASPVRVESGWLTAAPSVDVAGYGLLVRHRRGALPVPVSAETLRVDRPRYTHPGGCL